MNCPNDTNGDGNCGRKYCPYCGVNAMNQPVPKRSSWIADLLSKLGSEQTEEKGLVKYLNNYATAVAVQTKDFKLSSAVREILENPESKPKAFQLMLNAARFHILASLLMEIGNGTMINANQMLNASLGLIPKFDALLTVNDNPAGEFIWDSLSDLLEHFGFEALKKVKLSPEQLRKKIIE